MFVQGFVVVIADELKDAVVAMMMRKDELENQMKFVLFIHFQVFYVIFSWILFYFCHSMALFLVL